MKENFVPRLNEFTELLKSVYAMHAENIVKLGKVQKDLRAQNDKLREEIKKTRELKQYNEKQMNRQLSQLYNLSSVWQGAMGEQRKAFQYFIHRTNEQLGSFSSHWGSYLETLGVQYMLNTLKKDFGMHTSIQKFKRCWHESRNVEIDLLGISDTHAYVVEVKNKLKEETFKQMLITLDKIKEKIPEYAHLTLQPVIICMYAEEQVVNTSLLSGVWIVRYCGFDPENARDEFEWLRRDDVW